MRALMIDEQATEKVQRVLDWALDPAHWYRPHKDARVPGDDPCFVTHLDMGYRCVFTITEDPKGITFRHLSISVPPAGEYPHVVASWTIASMFGFTGWDGRSFEPPRDWLFHLNKDEHCIVVAQEYKP